MAQTLVRQCYGLFVIEIEYLIGERKVILDFPHFAQSYGHSHIVNRYVLIFTIYITTRRLHTDLDRKELPILR